MDFIKQYLDIRFEKHKQDWDTVIVICGDVGVGKSNLALHMLEHWTTLLNGECKEEDIKHMCLTKEMFVEDLSDSKPMECTIFDEAGDLASRRAMSDFNVKLMIAYKVIRADRIFTILVIDDLWDLDSYFRNKRVKALFYVYRRGRAAVFLKDKLRLLAALNDYRNIKSYRVTYPNFLDSFPKYKGRLAEKYLELKKDKTAESRAKLKESIGEPNPRITHEQIARVMGVSRPVVSNLIKKYKEKRMKQQIT